jgi:hypothetical protein
MNWTYLKPFEQELHDLYDQPAKLAVGRYIEKTCGIEVYGNPDKYGIDLLLVRNEKIIGMAEVEVRQWSPNCPYPTIHVPERKTKFFKERTLFFALTKDMQHAYWIECKDIMEYPVKEVRNVKVSAGEMFFDVPTNKFNYVEL